MDKKVQAALLFVVAVFIFMAGSKYAVSNSQIQQELVISQPLEEKSSTKQPEQTVSKEIFVHVSGAVKKPGLYKLAHEARVNDAIELAQPLPKADIDQLNLAAKLSDGQKISVPVRGEKTLDQSAVVNYGVTGGSASTLVNINTASAQDLDALPGIGPSYAQKIIQYRTEHGPFQKTQDIENVPGIGPKKYEDMKERITVN